MNGDFDDRWRRMVEMARQDRDAEPVEIPAGLADSIVTRVTAVRLVTPEQDWFRQGWRALVAVSIALAVCLTADKLGQSHELTSFLPPVEPTELTLPWTS